MSLNKIFSEIFLGILRPVIAVCMAQLNCY